MNIGIAGNVLIFEKAGIGEYGRNLLREILKIDSKNQYFLFLTFVRNRKIRIENLKKSLGGKFSKNLHLKLLPIPAAWFDWLTALPIDAEKTLQRLSQIKIDLWFAPYMAGIPKKGFSKKVATVHDLVFLRFPEHRGKKISQYYLKRHKIAAQNCQKLIAVSSSTKKDLINFLKVTPKKIVVIPEAASDQFRVLEDKSLVRKVTAKYINPDLKYILSVCTLEPRKNLGKLIEAFSMLPYTLLKNYRLVLIGAQGWNNNLEKIIENFNLKDKVILPGFVSEEDLPYIYNRASVFVYPSLYEGFGLPPLEAMACGIPVVSSNISSLPEVVGKAGILIDPANEIQITTAIKNILIKPKLAKQLSKKGLAQSKKFSWEKTAQKTLKVLNSLSKEVGGESVTHPKN